jgi:hypothetical protein
MTVADVPNVQLEDFEQSPKGALPNRPENKGRGLSKITRSPDGTDGSGTYGRDINNQSSVPNARPERTRQMASEFDLQSAAQYHQTELLAEAASRRLTRTSELRREDPIPTARRLQTLLRRLAGAPTFA